MKSKKVLFSLLIVIMVGVVAYLLSKQEPVDQVIEIVEEEVITSEIIGYSVEGREISAEYFGDGEDVLAFVGGIHGGYEWNSVVLAYEMIDYLESNPQIIPDNIKIAIIPNLNPDGMFAVTGLEGKATIDQIPAEIFGSGPEEIGFGRFNANQVDLNRNFDCKWQPKSTWRGNEVDAGSGPFSEPEAQAIRKFVQTQKPKTVVFWHSKANNVYASECENGVLPETLDIMNAYSEASGYGAVAVFDAYPVTGDAEGWLASIGIPSITVELKTRDNVEFEQNLAGLKSVINYFSK
jgi:hypothetical protein